MNDIVEFCLKCTLFIYFCLEAFVLMFVPRRWRYKDVKGEIVLITGGGSGLGRQMALGFADLGCRVVVWDVNEKGCRETCELVSRKGKGGDCSFYVCDVSKRDVVYSTAQRVKDEVGHVTILVNNAGIVTGKKMLDCPDHLIEKTFQVNAISHFWTCKSFIPYMMARNRGHIVTIASLGGLVGTANLTDYCSSKFAAVGFHESLFWELRKQAFDGIKMTLVCPAVIKTGLFEGASFGYFNSFEANYVASEVISSVLTNEELVMLPRALKIPIGFKFIFPNRASIQLYEALKGDKIMDEFVGRSSKTGRKR